MLVPSHLSAAPALEPFHTETFFVFKKFRGRGLWASVFLLLGVPTVLRKINFVLKCVQLTNPAYGGLSQVGDSFGI